jgi:porphobilinogen synthase
VLGDVEEGADMVMVKPAGPYLDVIRRVREAVNVPVVAYQVSGEYSLLKAAAERGWIDERAAALETLVGIKRAGADLILSYFAPQMSTWLGVDK